MRCNLDTSSPTISYPTDNSIIDDSDNVLVELTENGITYSTGPKKDEVVHHLTRWERRHPGKKKPVKTHKIYRYHG